MKPIAMHIAIVLGAGLVMWLGSPLPMLSVLILIKTFLDIRLHKKERGKLFAAHWMQAQYLTQILLCTGSATDA